MRPSLALDLLAPSLEAFARRIGALRGALTGRAPEITPEVVRMGLRTFSCDCSRAARELGFRVVPLRDMVADAWTESGKAMLGYKTKMTVAELEAGTADPRKLE